MKTDQWHYQLKAKRKKVEEEIYQRLHRLKKVTATVMTADRGVTELGLKIGNASYPHMHMENDVLIFRENQEIVYHEDNEEDSSHFFSYEEGEKLQEEATLLIWRESLKTQEIPLRIIFSRPLRLKEWYKKLIS